ncbi:TetR/AcrR family transcriptional regulator [Cellulomonas soli]|uniref:Putative transcriptional regulator, TetR family protein n=1 Tax=Cellulomonas soli TaxID=931535 RepID=A0A512PAQ8_9CELL|nr:TetR/AcrR family transcriptional regulator [Cellulomonas soli]NYI57419.1 AcrR family transcriptional regulator [Cellulomonas soli]GEP68300.1 putative transcriptional regulator, TetR family protein [Cellulomonas soli]
MNTVSSKAQAVRPGRPRSQERRLAVLHAAAELALEDAAAPTMDAIATRAGVSRTTLYKWWPSPSAVLLEGLLEHFHESIELDDALPVREALTGQVDALVHLLRDTAAGTLLRGLMAASSSDRTVGEAMLDTWLRPRREHAVHHLHRGIADGSLRAGTDVEIVTDALFAPVYHRLVWGHAPLEDDLAERICDLVWSGIAAP